MCVLTDLNLSPNNIIISFKKHSHFEIYNSKQPIIKDSIDVYDYLVLIFAAFGQSIIREEIKQIFPLIQSSKEEYYNIVDLDLHKNYDKILEERGYID